MKKPAAVLKIHVYHPENILPHMKIIWSLPIYQWFASNVKSTILNLKPTRPEFLVAPSVFRVKWNRPPVYKTFFMLNSTEHEFSTGHKN